MLDDKFQLICTECGTVQSKAYSPMCEQCNGLTEIEYDLSQVELRDSENPFFRFFDILPIHDASLLPQNDTYTPAVHAKNIGKKFGIPKLYLKNETVLPTGTTKYRMAAIALPYLFESGVRHFCTSSTGNSSTAYAQLMTNIPGLKLSLFTGSEFQSRVNYRPSAQIDHYVMHGATFVEAFDYAGTFAKEHGYVSERGFFNVGRREGLKLAFCEATDQIHQPIDWYVQAVSSAMGVYGTWRGANQLKALGHIEQLPRLLCVQQESCAPMVKAWKENAEKIAQHHIVERPHGIAKAILRGNPWRVYPYMRKIVKETRGTFEAVSEQEIRDARALVKNEENIDICFSAATAVAGLIKSIQAGVVPADETILINLTGSDRPVSKHTNAVIDLVRQDNDWVRAG